MVYVFEVEEGSSGDLIYVILKREDVVKENAEVATLWPGKESGVVYGEVDVVGGFDEGIGAGDYYV